MSGTMHWFYMADLPAAGETALLDEREAKHATGSRRLNVDDVVSLFDGRGNVATAAIVSNDKSGVRVQIKSRNVEQQRRPRLNLASALPKGDRQNILLSMATQLGMSAFAPLLCARSIVKPGGTFSAKAQRICIEACKQSRRAHLPVIQPVATLEDVAHWRDDGPSAVVMAHPGGSSLATVISETQEATDITIIVGPEGGFTPEEVQRCTERGGLVASLGEGVLRIETAAVCMLAAFMLHHIDRND